MASTNLGGTIRVLAVDDDETDLGSLQSALLSLGHEGENSVLLCRLKLMADSRVIQGGLTTCRYHDDAISLLRKGGREFCVVIANVNGSIGFHLVGLVGRNMGLPMIAPDLGLKSTVTCLVEDDQLFKTAIVNGASLALVKQRLMDNLWLIWQLVLSHRERNNAITVRELASGEAVEQPERRASDNLTLERSYRLVWTGELKRKFIEAYNNLGDEEATPKKIHKLMKLPSLTKENISSHLQKYRHALKKKEAPKTEGQKASVAKSPGENSGVSTIEPVSMNLIDNAEQLPSSSTRNAHSLPNNSGGSGFRSSFHNTSMQHHYRGTESRAGGVMARTMSSCPDRQLTYNSMMDNGANCFFQLYMDGGLVPPNGVLDPRCPIVQSAWYVGEPSRSDHRGVESMGSQHMFDMSRRQNIPR